MILILLLLVVDSRGLIRESSLRPVDEPPLGRRFARQNGRSEPWPVRRYHDPVRRFVRGLEHPEGVGDLPRVFSEGCFLSLIHI